MNNDGRAVGHAGIRLSGVLPGLAECWKGW